MKISHPFDNAIVAALASVETTTKDRLLRRLIGLSQNSASDHERFDALAIEQIVTVSVESGVPVRVKIGGDGNLVASRARLGSVAYAGEGVFDYTPLEGYIGADQFAVKDGKGRITLVRLTVR